MPKISRTPSRLARTALLAAPALLAVAAPAVAQKMVSKGIGPSDPIMQEAEMNAGPNKFVINSNLDRELIRFKQPRKVELCAPAPHTNSYGHDRGYPLKVTYDGKTRVIPAASCSTIQARRIRVAAASRLPRNTVLEGTLRSVK